MLCCLRIGEARNPGPCSSQQFVLGSCNPSGLNYKAQYVSTHVGQCDVLAVAETHLSTKGMQSFRSSLKFHSSQFKACVGGHPVPHDCSNGRWKGVAVLAAHPTRVLPQSWPPEIAESARAMIAATLVNNAWVTGGVMYGEPDGHLHPAHRMHNEVLLQHVAGHVCHLARGFRYVAGDFNELLDSLPAFQILYQAGFKDLQTLALERFGQTVANTCKHKTRKDFLFISPELQDLLLGVDVVQDIFPDHAVLLGRFQSLSAQVPVMKWFVPSPFPWPKQFHVDAHLWSKQSTTATERYVALWRHIECQAASQVPFVVPNNAFGRGQTLAPKPVRCPAHAPLRTSRKGDFQPQFHGVSWRHAQWTRQVRRLQAYSRFMSSTKQPRDVVQGAQMWSAIVHAKGFVPSFPAWWSSCSHVTHGAPSMCPRVPPDEAIARAMYESLVVATRALEAQLIKSSRQYAKLRRAKNPNLIFQDVKDASLGGPELLACSLVSEIESIDETQSVLVLSRAQDWTDQPILCNGSVLPVIHADLDGLWLESVEGLSPGMSVSQVLVKGTIQDLSREFLSTWKQRWQRHADIPPERWLDIVNFAKHQLPAGSFTWPSLDVSSLQQVISAKKSRTSAGPDGVSFQDLTALPKEALANFCHMFALAEATGEWPDQVIAGRVSSIAKTAAPRSALDFRPITVLGLLYRCWSSFHSQCALRRLDSSLPDGLAGSRPNKYAGQVWASLLWDLENAYASESDLGGVVADLQKAFNHLPRHAVMELCAHVGLPCKLLLGWAGALTSMARRFQIRDHITEPLYSCTGVPEGCALSCVAMMVIDWTLHAWFRHYLPLARPLTYVDDWQVVTTDSAQIGSIMDHLLCLAEKFDLLLDNKKTYSWSISASGRTYARSCGFRVVANTRNLGAHVQYTRQHTNSAQMERILALQPLWPRLRVSASSYSNKLRAILMAAWPRGLHAIAATTVSSQCFQSLRSGALRGLNVDGAGCNAQLHLGLIEHPAHDPQFWSVLNTFCFVRDCGEGPLVQQMLSQLVSGDSHAPDNSISSTLLVRLQTLGWHVTRSGIIVDQLGSFSLFEVCKQELELRAARAWQDVVTAEVAHRKGFQELHRADPRHVRQWLKMLSCSDRALFCKVLNGAHFTQDVKSFSQPGTSTDCVYCGSTDSRYHRFWQCEFFSEQRASFPHALWDLLPRLPEVLTSYGWSLKPSTEFAWQSMLAQLSVHSPPALQAPNYDVLHFFTDGSCMFQHDHDCRFAAWSVVFAPAEALSADECRVVDSGVLPGLIQSAYRAEVYAVLRALESCRCLTSKVSLWSDCEAVIKRLRKCIKGYMPRVNSPHADLWIQIFHLISQYPFGHVCVFKVAAHCNEHDATNCVEEWCHRNNNLADRTAVRANFLRPASFWTLLEQHLDALTVAREISRHVQHVQLEISRVQVRYADDIETPCVQVAWEPVPACEVDWSFHCLPAAAARWYGQRMVRLLVSWFFQCVDPVASPVVWISHYQLYLDFQMATGEVGPIHLKTWADGSALPLVGLRDFPFKRRVRWFIKVLREILRHMHISIPMKSGRPHSESIAMHTGIWAIPWPKLRVDLVDSWICERLQSAATRGGKALDSLPLATRCGTLPDVVLTTACF